MFVPASWAPVYEEGQVFYFRACSHGPVTSTWAPDESFRFDVGDTIGDLTLSDAEALHGHLSAALGAAEAAGEALADELCNAVGGRGSGMLHHFKLPPEFTRPSRDPIDGSVLSFDLPECGSVSASWHPENGFSYAIDNSLYVDGRGARNIWAALGIVLAATKRAQQRMDDMHARWQAGEDLSSEVEWR